MSGRTTSGRWLKFNAVGGIGILVQLCILTLLTRVLGVNYLLATVLAVAGAVVHNFWWHARFTWADRVSISPRPCLIRFLKFTLTAGLFSMLGNVALMWLLAGRVGLAYVPANLITIAVCSTANFLMSDWFVFRTLGARVHS
jgi:putative flippase GtrA